MARLILITYQPILTGYKRTGLKKFLNLSPEIRKSAKILKSGTSGFNVLTIHCIKTNENTISYGQYNVLRSPSNIYNGAFSRKYLTT